MMLMVQYDRARAVRYAHKWAYDRNPKYARFDNDGGDCTNFASQALFAGSGVMHERDWYYRDADDRAPAWTGVVWLHRFLVGNRGLGPFAAETDAGEAQPGDIVQLRFTLGDRFRHSPVIVRVGNPPAMDNILVAAHSLNADDRRLDSYAFAEARFLHILGVRR